MAKELDADTYDAIVRHCKAGDLSTESGVYATAIESYRAALTMIPHPRTDWNASTWVLGVLGDAYLFSQDYEQAAIVLEEAMHCPDGLGNPYLHLRLGQCYFDLGQSDMAADHLMRAYMGGGAELFSGQDDKYFAFLRSRAEL